MHFTSGSFELDIEAWRASGGGETLRFKLFGCVAIVDSVVLELYAMMR
jgi:hypothetical protein